MNYATGPRWAIGSAAPAAASGLRASCSAGRKSCWPSAQA